MKAMAISEFGGPEVLKMVDLPVPEPGPGEVQIKVHFASVNPADWKCREGFLKAFFEYKFPFVIGFDAAGTVTKLGPGVTGFKVGDRVLTSSNQGMGENGSYAEYLKALTFNVCHIPAGVSDEQAATIPVAGGTAWGAVFEPGELKAGQTLLVNGGSSSCGIFAIQFARMIGAKVAATCGPANVDFVRGLGADLVIDYRSQNVLEEVARWAPGGVDLVVDAIGLGSLPADTAKVVKRGGRIVCIATLINDTEAYDKAVNEKHGVAVMTNMISIERRPVHLAAAVEAVASGKVKTPPYEVMTLAEAPAAQEKVKAAHVRGKILLKVA